MQIFVPQILIPKFIEAHDPMEAKMGLWGEFHVIKKRRNNIIQELKFKNVITDVGLIYLATDNVYLTDGALKNCQLGTGTAIPTSTDTRLQTYGTYKAKTSSGSGSTAYNDYYKKVQIDFGLSEANGTWTELGMSWTSGSGSSVFCRTLFKDDNGNPAPMQKTSEDTLTIIYYLHIIRSSDTPTINQITVDGVGVVNVQSLVLNTMLSSVANDMLNSIGWENARLGTNTAALDVTQTGCRTPINTAPAMNTVVAHVSGAYYREFMYEWPASVVGNIAEAALNVCHTNASAKIHVAMLFDPVIPKTDITKKIRLRARVTYARAA